MRTAVGGDSHEASKKRGFARRARRGARGVAAHSRSVVSSPQVWRAGAQTAIVLGATRGLAPVAAMASVTALVVTVIVAWSQVPEMGGA